NGVPVIGPRDRKDGDTRVVLMGRIVVLPGVFVRYTHPNGLSADFDLREVEIRKTPTLRNLFNKQIGAAGTDAGSLMQAANWALKKGMLAEFHQTVEKALQVEPRHPAATRVAELSKLIRTPLPDDPEVETKLRSLVPRPGLRIERSNHFILLTDTLNTPRERSRKSRAHEQFDLLERFYESFLLLLSAQG